MFFRKKNKKKFKFSTIDLIKILNVTKSKRVTVCGDEKIQRCSHNRNVRFPDENAMVTGYHDAPKPVFNPCGMQYFISLFVHFYFVLFLW